MGDAGKLLSTSGRGLPHGRVSEVVSSATTAVSEGMAAMAEDKSPKETWKIPRGRYRAAALWTALIAGWVYYPELTPQLAEYAIRGCWAAGVPLRMRRYIGAAMTWSGGFLPHYHFTEK